MKYIARADPDDRPRPIPGDPAGDGPDDGEIVELAGAGGDLVLTGSSRRLVLVLGFAVAVIGFAIVGQVSGPPRPARAGTNGEAGRGFGTSTEPTRTADANGTGSEIDAPLVINAPADGATVTGDDVFTGAVVVVKSTARQALGVVSASVSLGGAILGCRDADVEIAGPVEIRIPVFPPAFDVPVVLRLASAPLGGRPGFAIARQLRLDIPSVVGFWEATRIRSVDRSGGFEIVLRGYAPRAARAAEIEVKDSRGVVVADTSAAISDDVRCPDSPGGGIFGLGSFVAHLRVAAGSTGPLTLEARWRDAATGQMLHIETSFGPINDLAEGPTPGR